MAALAHLGVGFAAKRVAPKIPLGVLLIGAWVIDILWGIFYFLGIEHMPGPDLVSPWSHGLVMSMVWSVLAGIVTTLATHNPRTGRFMGLLVFSHWIVDFISQPMRYLYPGSGGLPILFEGSPTVGLGLYSTALGTYVGEYGTLILGVAIYILTIRRLKTERDLSAGANTEKPVL